MPELPPKAVELDGVDIKTSAETSEEPENIGAKIVTGGAWRLIAYGFATVVAVLSTAVVSRTIGPVDFAAYTTAISLISIASGFTDFGLLALGIREFASLRGAERERHLRALITLRLIFTSMGAVVIVVFAIIAGYSSGVVEGLAVASVGLCVMSFFISYCVPLQATYRFNELAALDAGRQVLWSGLMILAAVSTGAVGLIIASLLPAAIVVTIAAALLAHRIASIVPSWDPATMRLLLASVGAFAIAASIGASYAFLAQVASDAVLSGYDSGQFALAFRVFSVLIGAGYVVIIGAFPLLVTTAKEDLDRMAYATRRVMQTGILAGFACAVGLLSGATFVVAIIGGPEFEGAIELLAIIGFATPASFVLMAGSTVLLAAGHHRVLVLVAVVGAAISIVGTAALAAEFGGTGAAAGIVIGEFILAAGYLTAISRVDRRALPTWTWFGGVLLAVLAGCAVSLIGLPSLIAALLAMAVYGAAALLLGILPPEIRDRIPLIRAEPALNNIRAVSGPGDQPSVDAVVVAWNNCELTLDCLAHIEHNSLASRLIVVDNGSSDNTVEAIRERFPAATILELGENIGYGPAMNRGIAAGEAEFVALINNDANIEPEFLALTIAAFEDERVGMVGGIALRPVSGDIDVAAIIVDRGLGAYPFLAARKQTELDVSDPRIVGPSHVNVVYRRAALDEVGTFDTEFFVYHEDIDLVLRMRQAGWESRVLSGARSIHIGSASVGKRTAKLVELSSWGRGYLAGRYRVAFHWLLLDLASGIADCIAFRELTPLKSKITGWRHGRKLPRRYPPAGIEYVSFFEAMRLRRNALLGTD